MGAMSERRTATLTIAASATASDGFRLGQFRLAAIELPAAFTGTNLALQGAASATSTYKAIEDDGGNVAAWTVAAGTIYAVTKYAAAIAAMPYLRVVADAQAAERTILVHLGS